MDISNPNLKPKSKPSRAGTKRGSSWGSEESRDFLQERIHRFAGVSLGISVFFFLAGWAIAWRWSPEQLVRGLPIATTHLLYLAAIAVTFLIWLATRGAPLPGAVLLALD